MKIDKTKREFTFADDELERLYALILNRYFERKNIKSSERLIMNGNVQMNAQWKEVYNDFHSVSCYAKSKIQLGFLNKKIKELRPDYFYKHLISKDVKTFKYEYLKRIIYYLTYDNTVEVEQFLLKNKFQIDEFKLPQELPKGLEFLEGSWIGINRNLEESRYAVCHYNFQIVGNKMMVQREAYSSEIMYEGEAFLQEDLSFMFHMVGRSKGRIKFGMANPRKIEPDMLKCYSSAYSTISPQEPAIVKELIIRLPYSITLGKGDVMPYEELIDLLAKNFGDPLYYKEVIKELQEFLGDGEEHVFTLQELSEIKKADMTLIKNRHTQSRWVEKLYAYFQFHHLQNSDAYQRHVIKYEEDRSSKKAQAVCLPINVKEEYTLHKTVKYNKPGIQKHEIAYRTKNKQAAVDVQALFPICDSVLSNHKDEQDLRSSQLLMDADTDFFVHSATFLNEFSPDYQLALSFDEVTKYTEIVIDFGSIGDFETRNIYPLSVEYKYNDADGRGGERCELLLGEPTFGACRLSDFDPEENTLKTKFFVGPDPENPKIFIFILDFEVQAGDVLYIYFNHS